MPTDTTNDPYPLRDSLAALDHLFAALMHPDSGLERMPAQAFADAWQGARHFRDQTLLLLARYACRALRADELPLVCRRLVDFAFEFLPLRQIAFTFDLVGTLADAHTLQAMQDLLPDYARQSRYTTQNRVDALASGLSGTYFFEPEKLVNLQKQDAEGELAAASRTRLATPLGAPLFISVPEGPASKFAVPPRHPAGPPPGARARDSAIQLLGAESFFEDSDALLEASLMQVATRLSQDPELPPRDEDDLP